MAGRASCGIAVGRAAGPQPFGDGGRLLLCAPRERHAIVVYTPMVAMPYILVDIVLARVALIFFCITSAALLSTCPFANAYLPARLRHRTGLAFLAHGLWLAALALVGLLIITKFSRVRSWTRVIFEARRGFNGGY